MHSRLAFISDVHFGGQEDLRAWNFTLKILPVLNLDEIILGGDIFDHEAVGRFRKNPDKCIRLHEEITNGVGELEKLVTVCPVATISFYRGNHERRLPNYLLDTAKALYGLDVFEPPTLYKLDALGIHYIPETQPFKRGHLWLAHGDEFPTSGVSPAAKALDKLNSNILFGHVHRVSTYSKRQLNKRCIAAWSNSCLCRLDPDYTLNPEWTQGFTLVDFTTSGYFSVTPVTYWYNRKLRRLQTLVEGTLYG